MALICSIKRAAIIVIKVNPILAKKVPLCKPFTVCTTDGYVDDTFVPFLANLNDAQIKQIILTEQMVLAVFLKEEIYSYLPESLVMS